MMQSPQPAELDHGPPEQVRIRHDKRERIIDEGGQAYPAQVARTTLLTELRKEFAGLPSSTATGEFVAVAGRVVSIRTSGKLHFATLREGGGTELQVMLSLDRVGAETLGAWKRFVDLGDLVGVEGEVITSARGELSVLADRWTMAAKALRPLPVPHRPMSPETRVRQRYLDLIMRPQARDTVRARAAVVRSLRDHLHDRGFTEVETPMLQPIPGGAAARPFVTHANALDHDVYLRVAPELYLKRCVVGGIERVFEINRNFRNEGIDSAHSPEFAMLEAYESYGDYHTIAVLTRELVQAAALAVAGSHTVCQHDGAQFDLSGEWTTVTLFDALSAALGEAVGPDTPMAALVAYAAKHGIGIDATRPGAGWAAEQLFEALVVPTLQQPTFVMDYPVQTSPLTRTHRRLPELAEKWDLYIGGVELATGYSELTDPVIQRERLVAQAGLAAAGDPEAMRLDEDFLRAMEHGMPPMGGMGLGVDRLMMVLTGLGIRETILFPLIRPR